MEPGLFLDDLEAKPGALREFAARCAAADPFAALDPARVRRILLLGMGSSRYAAGIGARRLRAAGIAAACDYASAIEPGTGLVGPGTLVVAVSATGTSREVLDAVAGLPPANLVAITNETGSELAGRAGLVVPMHAGVERSGIACRTFGHTLALMVALEAHFGGGPAALATLVEACRRAADATDDLLRRRDDWLGPVAEALDGPDGVHTIAPAGRLSSAQQSALMVREIPRRAAHASETGDWSHVDVYLSKTLDYRTLLFPGSRYDNAALAWLHERRCTIVAVGADIINAAAVVRFPGDADPLVRLLTETLVGELIASRWGPR